MCNLPSFLPSPALLAWLTCCAYAAVCTCRLGFAAPWRGVFVELASEAVQLSVFSITSMQICIHKSIQTSQHLEQSNVGAQLEDQSNDVHVP